MISADIETRSYNKSSLNIGRRKPCDVVGKISDQSSITLDQIGSHTFRQEILKYGFAVDYPGIVTYEIIFIS